MRNMRTIIKRLYASASPYGSYSLLDPSTAMTTYPTVRQVPTHIARPSYVPSNFFTGGWGDHEDVEMDTSSQEGRLDERGVAGVRRTGRMAAEILRRAGELVRVGMTTDEIDRRVHEMIVAKGAYPSPLGYSSFPRSITTSVNNVVAHGIPDGRPLESRDIINIDLTMYYGGYHGDTSATFMLPDVDDAGRQLVEATEEALKRGISVCGPGVPLNEIGRAISGFASKEGFSVNEQFSGHGIGAVFHQEPWILHHENKESGTMEIGDCFTIEPALVQGRNSRGMMWDDGWTMSTESGARSAQFEHQILITEDGVEILTKQ